MELNIYKGFDNSVLSKLKEAPVLDLPYENRKDVIHFDRQLIKKLRLSLYGLEEDDVSWMTYEEYSFVETIVDDIIESDGLRVKIINNNLYPGYYPIEFKIDDSLATEINKQLETATTENSITNECKNYIEVYNSLIKVGDKFYGSFYNREMERRDSLPVENYYPSTITVQDSNNPGEYSLFLNDDFETYIRDLNIIKQLKPKSISFSSTDGFISKNIESSLIAFAQHENIKLFRYYEKLQEEKEQEAELIRIAKEEIGIPEFKEFRKIKFYKNPDIDNHLVEIPQSQIITDIIRQAERAYDDEAKNRYRDIFITASTGAGKSIMFQIPAVYLAQKYNKLTIIIEPVKALMQDQKEQLIKHGYNRVEAFNSDLISQVEKEAVLKRIKDGEVDLLYLSPETLLSYTIDTIIGDREIGLMIVDEAHIVTTWGVGFRPDYWYLGGYINRLRNTVQTSRNKQYKTYRFPVCAFTATAINGGDDNTVSETITSLYMENPIKYLGYVKRDDIKFEITLNGNKKLPMQEYESLKGEALDHRVREWIDNGKKVIVYFPYASFARDAFRGYNGFANIITDKNSIGIYTGRNMDEISSESFAITKRDTFEKFKNGELKIMYATKAFGMGVDVNDVDIVYHYAVTGTLNDYVQEIGRAARKTDMIGYAVTDNYYNDISFMQRLFGMSQIKQYQINKVLAGIYDVYRNKQSRNFLISPEAFTYIFSGKNSSDDSNINKLKTSLLMLEKDLYDKYHFKVLVSRPQSVFTKAFVVIDRDHEKIVLQSKYGKYFTRIEKGRVSELQADGSRITDLGDVYNLDLKTIWEEQYANLSFPSFKFWYFNAKKDYPNKVDIMPTIRQYIFPRQRVNIETRHDLLLCDIRDLILQDFEYIGDALYEEFRKKYFTLDDFKNLISKKYGATKARIIANSLFDLVDPNQSCVKYRINEATNKTQYTLSNGNFKEYMRKSILKSQLISNLNSNRNTEFSRYAAINDEKNQWTATALKLLSIFDYITYEIQGGEEPEIFIRLNDPAKVAGIVNQTIRYSNNYVTKARQKHERDVKVLNKFFSGLSTDEERWNYIEDYFLGKDVLEYPDTTIDMQSPLSREIDKEHSYSTHDISDWREVASFYEANDKEMIDEFEKRNIPLPEYMETEIKKSSMGEEILMSWPSKNVLIFQEDASEINLDYCNRKGWHAYKRYEINYTELEEILK